MMKFNDVLFIADLWKSIGGISKIELGALEPLLWRDENLDIVNLVSSLTKKGFQVNLTSNGQLLSKFSERLLDAGLNKLRVSWHTTNPILFKEISGGYGDYELFFSGIKKSLKIGLKISFNRLLLNGHLDDIFDQINFIQEYGSRLKLYTLMWTSENQNYYNKFFIDWRPVIRNLKGIQKIERDNKSIGRSRLKFHLLNNSVVEVKISEFLDRNKSPCNKCIFNNKCEEAFGDYLRIDPNMISYFCYLRKDISFALNNNVTEEEFEEFIVNHLGKNAVKETPLRLTISPFCNFNCRIPGENKGWCMEYNTDYIYPKIKGTLLL